MVVELGEVIEHDAFRFPGNTGWVVQEKDGVAPAAELDALVSRGEETAAPEAVIEWLATFAATRGHGDKGGKVGVLFAKSITSPSAHAWSASDLGARLKEGDGGIVIDRVGDHGFHETDLIGDAGGVWDEFTQPGAACAMLREVKHGRGDGKAVLARGHGGDALATSHTIRQVLIEHGLHPRFGIKQIHLGRAAALEEVDDAFGLGGKVKAGGAEAIAF